MATKSPVTIVPDEQSAENDRAERLDHRHGENEHDRQQRGDDHFAQRRLGHDVDAGAVFRHVFAAENARLGRQLPPNLTHDRARRFADGVHAERGEHERQQSADEKTNDDLGIVQRKFE